MIFVFSLYNVVILNNVLNFVSFQLEYSVLVLNPVH